TSGKTGITYPAEWQVTLPEYRTQLRVVPDIADHELSNLRSISGSYWEGSVTVRGTYQGRPVKGKGYVELVGYGKALEEALPE
ncbi:MAG: lipocalin family protein, partial [Nitrospinales bacterium]